MLPIRKKMPLWSKPAEANKGVETGGGELVTGLFLEAAVLNPIDHRLAPRMGSSDQPKKIPGGFHLRGFMVDSRGRLSGLAYHHLLSRCLEQFMAKGADEDVAVEFEGEVAGLDGHGVIPCVIGLGREKNRYSVSGTEGQAAAASFPARSPASIET